MRVPRESSPRARSESEPPPSPPVLRSFAHTKSDAPQLLQTGATRFTLRPPAVEAAIKMVREATERPDATEGGRFRKLQVDSRRLPRRMAPSRFSRIVVAIDGSPNAEEALAAAIDVASRYGSKLAILAVAPLVPVYLPSASPYVATPVSRSDVEQYRTLVDSAVKETEAAGVKSVTGVCLEGVVVDEILAFLEQNPTDLIVVGSRGLSATKRLLMGSISSALVTHAPCPVLVVRPRPPTKPSGSR